ncbi:MAG: hypothetical protein ACM3S0_15765 [Acidobacteriota bacterium]
MTDQMRDASYGDIGKMPNGSAESNPLTTADMAATAQKRETTAGTESMMRNAGGSGTYRTPLFDSDQDQAFRARWVQVQTGFVDEPRHAVEEADHLVAELMQDLARTFADEKNKLEGQWGSGQDVSTEDLRVALQRYRSFFDRLLSL